MPKIKKKKIQMHIAQRKELDVLKTKQKRDRNRTTISLVLDSSMQSGRWEFRLNQRIWLRLSSIFESRRISFFKIFLVIRYKGRKSLFFISQCSGDKIISYMEVNAIFCTRMDFTKMFEMSSDFAEIKIIENMSMGMTYKTP